MPLNLNARVTFVLIYTLYINNDYKKGLTILSKNGIATSKNCIFCW